MQTYSFNLLFNSRAERQKFLLAVGSFVFTSVGGELTQLRKAAKKDQDDQGFYLAFAGQADILFAMGRIDYALGGEYDIQDEMEMAIANAS